ncbi:MAG: FkbM family methyltransferase [Lachnospiraceae bacterium]|nr:FkbM family methyltransferase [Lachnospiraceae bacterium]
MRTNKESNNVIEEIFKEYRRIKDVNTIKLDQMRSDLNSVSDRIVLYGAGSAGIAFLYYLRDIGIYPVCFSDGNPKMWGKTREGLEIIDYHEIPERVGSDALVIITINTDGVKYCKSFSEALRNGGHEAVHRQLHESGCENVIDYTYFRRCRDLFRGDRYNLPSCSDIYEMEEHEKDICEAYELLNDEKSREVFEKIIRFRLIDDSVKIPTESQERQYFEYEFFPHFSNEVFVDCGAYNGISLNVFLRENSNRFSKYYGIEPDVDNYIELEKYVNSLPTEIRNKVSIFNKCAYDSNTDLRLYSLAGPGSFLADIGSQHVMGMRIDDIDVDLPVSFIKMNIEGTEIPALRGAKKTIRDQAPRLAIAGYHKTRDLWTIPLMINKMNDNYRFHIRSYMNNISFVFYAEV